LDWDDEGFDVLKEFIKILFFIFFRWVIYSIRLILMGVRVLGC
jgi:hypothetical protein